MKKINNIPVLAFLALLCFGGISYASELPPLRGFVENAFGARVSKGNVTKHKAYNMLEQRLQLKTRYDFSGRDILSSWQASLRFKGDFTLDEYFGGETDFDLRELNLAFSPFPFMDARIGRQVLTWGTGDYLFINDLFAKDYVSFYIGRDDEYLKKPQDALRFSFYPKVAGIDLVIMPFFEPNILPDGGRLSFFDSFQGGIAGRDSDRRLVEPSARAKNAEYALRAYRSFGSNEGALYYFRGFDKSPRSYKNQAARELYYERLDVYGASLRGPFLKGIANVEAGYYYSPEDSAGDNRLIENSSVKVMAGYEKDMGNDLKIGFQYLYERKLDYSEYTRALLPGDYFWDEHRRLVANRVTKLYNNQTVMVSLFTFYSPSDNDGYFRPTASYDATDQWKFTAGANIPWGEDVITDFGQMQRNKNIYFRARYSF